MGAKPARAMEMSVYDEEEQYDDRFSVRAPKALTERTEVMQKTERLRSLNKARVRALELGVGVYELVAERSDEFRAVRAEGRLSVEEAVGLLLREALDARSGKKPRK